jgi:hypothetical protein
MRRSFEKMGKDLGSPQFLKPTNGEFGVFVKNKTWLVDSKRKRMPP